MLIADRQWLIAAPMLADSRWPITALNQSRSQFPVKSKSYFHSTKQTVLMQLYLNLTNTDIDSLSELFKLEFKYFLMSLK